NPPQPSDCRLKSSSGRAAVRLQCQVLTEPAVHHSTCLDWLPKVISEMVGGALLGVAANRQVCRRQLNDHADSQAYRRFSACGRQLFLSAFEVGTACRLKIGDTAECNSALLWLRLRRLARILQ